MLWAYEVDGGEPGAGRRFDGVDGMSTGRVVRGRTTYEEVPAGVAAGD